MADMSAPATSLEFVSLLRFDERQGRCSNAEKDCQKKISSQLNPGEIRTETAGL